MFLSVRRDGSLIYLINFHVDSSKVDARWLKRVILFLFSCSLKVTNVSDCTDGNKNKENSPKIPLRLTTTKGGRLATMSVKLRDYLDGLFCEWRVHFIFSSVMLKCFTCILQVTRKMKQSLPSWYINRPIGNYCCWLLSIGQTKLHCSIQQHSELLWISTCIFLMQSLIHFVCFIMSQFNSLHCEVNSFTKKIFIPYPLRWKFPNQFT